MMKSKNISTCEKVSAYFSVCVFLAIWLFMLATIARFPATLLGDHQPLFNQIVHSATIIVIPMALAASLVFFNYILDLARDDAPIEETDFLC